MMPFPKDDVACVELMLIVIAILLGIISQKLSGIYYLLKKDE